MNINYYGNLFTTDFSDAKVNNGSPILIEMDGLVVRGGLTLKKSKELGPSSKDHGVDINIKKY